MNTEASLWHLWVYVSEDTTIITAMEEDATMHDVISVDSSSDADTSFVSECRCMACIWPDWECTCNIMN